MQGEEIRAAQAAFSLPDPRELNPLQLAYVGDTLHDLYVRSLLVSRKMSVGSMHKQAVRMVSAAAQAAAQTAGNIIMPLCGAFSAFGVSASLSPELKLTKLADMIKKLTIGVLSFVAAAFSAVLGLKSLLAGSADTLASKGIKLALSSAVPIVGGALSDAYSSIIGSVSLLKSTVGVFGVIAVVMIDLPVVLQLTARIILLKLLGVLSSSMGDDTTGEVLDTLSSALTVINAAVIFTAALFIISTGIVISVKAGA